MLLAILSISLMIADQRLASIQRIRSELSIAIVPFQYLVSAPVKAFDSLSQSLASREALKSENADLKVQLLLLKGQLQKFVAVEKENRQLRALLQSQPRASVRMHVAQIIAIDGDAFSQEVVLNQGRRNHVYIGQPVLDANGVIGQVIAADPITSHVLLLTDTRSAIPVMDTRSNVRGILRGTGKSETLKLMHISTTTDIRVGDLLETSGLGKRFPAGYPVGIVSNIANDAGEEFVNITVKVSANLNRSSLVLLIWQQEKVAPKAKVLQQPTKKIVKTPVAANTVAQDQKPLTQADAANTVTQDQKTLTHAKTKQTNSHTS